MDCPSIRRNSLLSWRIFVLLTHSFVSVCILLLHIYLLFCSDTLVQFCAFVMQVKLHFGACVIDIKCRDYTNCLPDDPALSMYKKERGRRGSAREKGREGGRGN